MMQRQLSLITLKLLTKSPVSSHDYLSIGGRESVMDECGLNTFALTMT